MSHNDIRNLLSRLHDSFGGNAPSPQVHQLMEQMQQQLQAGGDEALSDSASALLAEVEGEHPDGTALVLEIIEVLDRMGI